MGRFAALTGGLRQSEIHRLLRRLNVAPFQHVDPALEATLPLPSKDRPVLAVAIHQRCDALITGDRTQFGDLYGRAIKGDAIRSPRSFAEAHLR